LDYYDIGWHTEGRKSLKFHQYFAVENKDRSKQNKNSSQTQQFYYIITFKATCFNSIESSSGLVSTFIVHSGIPECTVDVDTLDLFSRRPDDDSLELKHVALNVII
jgi:hypothetical protein